MSNNVRSGNSAMTQPTARDSAPRPGPITGRGKVSDETGTEEERRLDPATDALPEAAPAKRGWRTWNRWWIAIGAAIAAAPVAAMVLALGSSGPRDHQRQPSQAQSGAYGGRPGASTQYATMDDLIAAFE